jgi:hypothetical protein
VFSLVYAALVKSNVKSTLLAGVTDSFEQEERAEAPQ